jgi:hypothetical protein
MIIGSEQRFPLHQPPPEGVREGAVKFEGLTAVISDRGVVVFVEVEVATGAQVPEIVLRTLQHPPTHKLIVAQREYQHRFPMQLVAHGLEVARDEASIAPDVLILPAEREVPHHYLSGRQCTRSGPLLDRGGVPSEVHLSSRAP